MPDSVHCYTPSWCRCPDEPRCQLCKQGRCPVDSRPAEGAQPVVSAASTGRLLSASQANALPIGSVMVMHGPGADEPVPHPGLTWFRIERGWINAYGSEVPARADWPYIGELGGPYAVTATFIGAAQ